MDVVIIAASPRAVSQSLSRKFSEAFSEGVARAGGRSKLFCLADRTQWYMAKKAFFQGDKVVFVLPIYIATLPGIMAEFLSDLKEDTVCDEQKGMKRSISFIVQGGLPKNGDYCCCAEYLKALPESLNSRLGGIIGFGDTLTVHFVEKQKAMVLEMLRAAGEEYVKNEGMFILKEQFWGNANMTEEESVKYCRFINRFLKHFAFMQGCEVEVSHRPYNNENES